VKKVLVGSWFTHYGRYAQKNSKKVAQKKSACKKFLRNVSNEKNVESAIVFFFSHLLLPTAGYARLRIYEEVFVCQDKC